MIELGNLDVYVVGAADSLAGDIMLMLIVVAFVFVIVVIVFFFLLSAWLGIGGGRT